MAAQQRCDGAAASSERPKAGYCGCCGAAACCGYCREDGDIRVLLLQRQPLHASAATATVATAGGGGPDYGVGSSSSSSSSSSSTSRSCALCVVARGVLLGEEWVEQLGVRQLAALAAGLRAAIGWPPSASASAAPAPADTALAAAAVAVMAEAVAEAVAVAGPEGGVESSSGGAGGSEHEVRPASGKDGSSGRCSSNGGHSIDIDTEIVIGSNGSGASVWAEATRGRPQTALLRLYGLASRHHIRNSSGSGNGGSSSGSSTGGGGHHAIATAASPSADGCCYSCCLAAKKLLLAAADVSRLAPGAVRAELGVCATPQSPAQQSQGPPAAAAGPTRTASARTDGSGDGDGGGGGAGGGAGRGGSLSGQQRSSRSQTSVAEAITRGLVAEVRHLLAACPRRLVPRLGTDGRAIVKYDPDGVAAADPCGTPPPTPAPAARAGPPPPLQPQSPVTADVALTVAAAALHALAALCRCSRAAARHAYLAGVLDELLADEAAARRLLAPPQTAAAAAAVGWPVGGGGGGGGVPGAAAAAAAAAAKRLEALRAAVVELYLALAGSCGSAAEDIVSGSDVRGLVALLCSAPREGIPAALRLRAAQRLAVLADSPSACGPDDFAHQLCRQGGGSGSSARDAPGPIASGASSSGSWCSPGPLEVALEWMAGEDSCCDGGPVGPEAVAAGARLLTACIDRARRMGWVVALPVPAPPPGFGRVAAAAALAARAPPLAVRLVLGLKGSVFEAWGAAVAAAAADGTRAALGPAALSGCWLDALLLAARIAERPAASAKPWASDEGAAAGQVVDVLLQRTRRLAAVGGDAAAPAVATAPPDMGGHASIRSNGAPGTPSRTAETRSNPADTIGSRAASGGYGGSMRDRDASNAAGPHIAALAPSPARAPSAQLLSSKAISSAPAGGQEPDQDQYDEDGLRVVWDSGPAPGLAAARSAWAARPLRERLTWSQTSTELFVNIVLPQGTRRAEVSLTITPTRLTLRLGWCGRVVDGPLHRKVAPSDCIWTLEGHTLQVLLAKAEAGHWWRALFEGGEEKGLYQVLSEAVEADEPLVPVEAMDEGGRLLLEELIERQEMIADGSFDLENSFDDFRLVVGDNTL
ncbi:hypothetical protein CHLRE_07g329600v5 [Chlamydomonas reinhardtii]|uniref:CS domain-containing protein n=1 Tax=Chlamydomonas reinhardtii TaxID=3055 RepID=A0A2K3DJS4_CHLRE|nr:uncharacterized protein CHLRE_07g329600v5 [Chlamydomonas reinhardtii]PNW80786.1 hypothetical protein CHLRE_07g329600v5 [Chlamydomonas reinhardtii]